MLARASSEAWAWPRRSMSAKRARTLFGLVGVCAGVFGARDACAYETEVQATLDAQFYALHSPFGDPLVRRRRYTQTLALSVYDIQGERIPRGPMLLFKSRVRLDSDFGQRPEERNPDSDSFVPGLAEAPLDVMYAYLEGQRYLEGYLGFRIGRQYVIDALGFWSFDGALATVTTPAHLAFEAYAGFEQRSGLPMLSSSRFEGDGVYRGDRRALNTDQYPSFLDESKLAPAFGFAVESSGLAFFHTRLAYRKVINRDTVLVSPFADSNQRFRVFSGDRTSSERLGYSLRVEKPKLGAATGSVVYDLYGRRLSQCDLGFDWYTTSAVVLGASIDYFLPTFDADSIFNWFAHDGMTSATGRAEIAFSRQIELAASGGVRLFTTEGDPSITTDTVNTAVTGKSLDTQGSLSGRYRFGVGSVGFNALAETGDRGHRAGGDLTLTKIYDGGYYDSRVVLSLYDWRDGLRPDRSATSMSYVLGAGVSPRLAFFGGGRAGVEWEQTINRLVGQRFRVLATLDFSVLR
jgi:hypothetical protein